MKFLLILIAFASVSVIGNCRESKYRCEDAEDDLECKRRGNEGLCGYTDEDFTCGCLFHDKPLKAFSDWNSTRGSRLFDQVCEPIKLPYHEDTCRMYLGNPKRKEVWEMTCPGNGFFQTWGAFMPEEDNYEPRLWYRCCHVKCPKWNCEWSPNTEIHKPFLLPLSDVYVQGARGKYNHKAKDSSWSLQLCVCDTSYVGTHEEL
uniref:Uncharacterized protein n=1 Tax=Ciona intestinalis TaxID=7719 RepID=F6W2T5_CIOIN